MTFTLTESHDDQLVFEICDECQRWTGRHAVKGEPLAYKALRCDHIKAHIEAEEEAALLEDVDVT